MGRHGRDAATLSALRRGTATATGTVLAAEVIAVKTADYSNAEMVDTLLATAAITFTNLVNRANDTVIDFPAVDYA